MKNIFGLIIAVSFTLASQAFAVSANWQNAFQKMTVSQNSMTDGEGFTYRFIEKLTPNDKNVAHDALYLTGKGVVYSTTNEYQVFSASVVFEKWTIDQNGWWVIEQWIFSTGIDGQLKSAMHVEITETRDGTIKDYKYLPTGTAEEQTALLDSLIDTL